jgi:hypothetical protein
VPRGCPSPAQNHNPEPSKPIRSKEWSRPFRFEFHILGRSWAPPMKSCALQIPNTKTLDVRNEINVMGLGQFCFILSDRVQAEFVDSGDVRNHT